MRMMRLVPVCTFIIPTAFAQSTCGDVQLQLTPDYSFAIGSSSEGNAFTFTRGSQTLAQGPMTQLALFHFDNLLNSTSGIAPRQATGTSFVPGKFGSALAIATGGILSYPAGGNISFSDGTIELWIAPTKSGTDPIYSQYDNTLFRYTDANGNQLVLSESAEGGGFYAGTIIGKTFTGVGGIQISSLKAGVWHHVAFTYSKANSRLRLYLDGFLVSENDAAFSMPASSGASFTIDSDPSGHASAFLVDELRISSDEETAAKIRYNATRSTPFANDEVLLSLAGVSPGQLGYSVNGCGTASYSWTGIPITNLNPGSNLLAPGSTSVNLSFTTLQPTTCAYSVGTLKSYASMQPFGSGTPSTSQQGVVSGLSSNPQVLNQVYLQCASNPDYVAAVQYRSVASSSPSFPRIGSIWWGQNLYYAQPSLAAKTSLFLGSSLTVAQVNSLRALNPDVLALPSLGSTYTPPPSLAVTPNDYLLKDVNGNPIAVWASNPPTYQLNMTRMDVAEWVANLLFQQIQQSNLTFDGVFLDSFSLTVADPMYDDQGNPHQISSQNNGVADNPTALNAAWQTGMLHEIDTLRKLAPNAYITCHCGSDPNTVSRFNGSSLVFLAVDAREGRIPFSTFWGTYNTWFSGAPSPVIVNVEDSPPNQLAYGYGQANSAANMPPEVFTFGQTFYPNMRFGLATALMGDGFFYHDYGDASPPVTWWYDEYDFSLGQALGPATQLGSAASSGNFLVNPSFENGLSNWQFELTNDGQAQATVQVDSTIAAQGSASAHIDVISAGTANWHVDLEQDNVSLVAGVNYQLQFWARADQPRWIWVHSQGGAPNFPNYGLNQQISIGTSWGLYSAQFVAPTAANDGRIQFWVGDVAGNVWIDGAQLSQAPLNMYRRDFTNGVALLNGTSTSQTIPLESGLLRFTGTQAPKYQYIVDDTDAGFSSTGSWNTVTYDSGVLWDDGAPTSAPEADGPYFHAWDSTVHELDVSTGTAQWNLGLTEDGQYTLQVWLPAAPKATSWTKVATYEVVSNGSVLATVTLDQTVASRGDGWHMIGTYNFTAAGAPFLRVHNGGSGSLIADAVYVTSAALYNDGSPAPQVTLAPFDGILLQRQTPVPATASRVNLVVVNSASYQQAIASAGFISIIGTGFSNSRRFWISSDFSGNNLPTSLDGVSVTINGKAAYVEYISPTQINAIAPDDETIGQVQVQVTTPQGPSFSGTVLKQTMSPAFFTYQSGTTSYAAAIHLDGTLVGQAGPSSRPAVPGEVIEIYGTGFGPTNPASPTSQLVSQPAPLTWPATVTIGGVNAQVQWAGLVSSGLYQLNVQIPNVATGDQPVQASVSGFQSVANTFVAVAQQ